MMIMMMMIYIDFNEGEYHDADYDDDHSDDDNDAGRLINCYQRVLLCNQRISL